MTFSNTQTNNSSAKVFRTIAVDVAIFLIIYLLPTISHLFPFPLYLMEPMRIAVLASYLLTRNNVNTSIIAVSIPLFSFLVTGHPVLFKSLLISVEFLTNILLFIYLIEKSGIKTFYAMILSILGSKIFYYGLKYTFIKGGLIEGSLVSTVLQVK
ncbi:MAG: hypothetical protein IPN97_04635 [Saprospiraceae bacterium]|nr:hypothetical protein [Saprospiraceae bacterium]